MAIFVSQGGVVYLVEDFFSAAKLWMDDSHVMDGNILKVLLQCEKVSSKTVESMVRTRL